MHVLLTICKALTVVGALNWGLVGFFKFDLVAAIFGEKSALSRTVYAHRWTGGGGLDHTTGNEIDLMSRRMIPGQPGVIIG